MKLCQMLVIIFVGTVVGVAIGDMDEKNSKYKKTANVVPHHLEPRSVAHRSTFLHGPMGEICILEDGGLFDLTYEHQEGDIWCCCNLCKSGYYVQNFCKCNEGLGEIPPFEKDTKCVHVSRGQYMPKHNNCTQPYTRSERCNAHQRMVSNFTARSDLVCECEEGWFNPDPSGVGNIPLTCRPKPLCPAGQEPGMDKRRDLIQYTCQPCPEGHFKAEDNSWKSCERHRQCLTRRGTATTDNECLNDIADVMQPILQEPSSTIQKQTPTTNPDISYATDRPTGVQSSTSSESVPQEDELSSAQTEDVNTKTTTAEPGK
ncbi:tumor necrosis factor receptor superfamily member 1B-like isoform X2 [Acanthaster planci]|uniref:Tumor necrosis factor receptor superfamily member 1B-like isoform X2 n=1 Tax=Acanthaster planci TaxID=133434 RepID=A0A8B7YAW1_ACAPL|nr:tumor necrosis factor receptor superfamily member 1B-like isoform X2 [Acanthaster planci]